MATLYVVSTPIGNLEDLTHRAARVLREVRHILAEDTRRTGILLRHLGGVDAALTSLHQHNEASRVERVVAWLDAGEDVALVCDAGTPLVADPGARLLAAVNAAGHSVVPVPGPSAVLAALAVAGFGADRFTFLGFAPRKKGERERLLAWAAEVEHPVVVFESPERVGRLLAELMEVCGAARRVAVARELTKLHETVVRGTLAEATLYYQDHAPRGEVTVVLDGAEAAGDTADEEEVRSRARALLEEGMAPAEAARELKARLGIPRNRAYEIVQQERDT